MCRAGSKTVRNCPKVSACVRVCTEGDGAQRLCGMGPGRPLLRGWLVDAVVDFFLAVQSVSIAASNKMSRAASVGRTERNAIRCVSLRPLFTTLFRPLLRPLLSPVRRRFGR